MPNPAQDAQEPAREAQEPAREAQEPPATPVATDTAPEAVETEDGPLAAARREAANYRRRLREVEAERDQLVAVVDGYRRGEVEALAGRSLARGDDLWVAGVDLADLLAEDGTVDPAKVEQATAATLEQRPHWRRSFGSGDGGVRGASVSAGFDFADVLRRAAT